MEARTTGNSHTTGIDPLDNIGIHITLIVRFRDLVDQQHAATERAATRAEEQSLECVENSPASLA
jgi:hypothetical protein